MNSLLQPDQGFEMLDQLNVIIQFFLAAFTVAVAGTYLTRFADRIAEVSGLGKLLVGSLLLAAATSLPELLVDLSAIRHSMPDLAVGDLMGSCLFNLFILACADFIHSDTSRLFSRSSAKHALLGTMSISVATLASASILIGPQLEAWSVGGMGIGTLAILIFFFFGFRLVVQDQMFSTPNNLGPRSGLNQKALVRPAIGYFASSGVLLLSAPYLAESAGEIASISGLSKTFVGTTLVAFATSLPELVSTFVAVRMGSYDLAVGNIYGSNAFNMILLAPLDFIHEGPLLAHVSKTHALTGMATILATSVAVMGQIYQVEKRKRLIEPDALLVGIIVLGSIGLLFHLS